MKTLAAGLIVAVIVVAGAAWIIQSGPADPGVLTTRQERVPVPTDSARSRPAPVAPVADEHHAEASPASHPESSYRSEHARVDSPEAPSGGTVREPEDASALPSSSVRRLPLPETQPLHDNVGPLRGSEAPLPGLREAADPTLLPSRPPEDQGATSTR